MKKQNKPFPNQYSPPSMAAVRGDHGAHARDEERIQLIAPRNLVSSLRIPHNLWPRLTKAQPEAEPSTQISATDYPAADRRLSIPKYESGKTSPEAATSWSGPLSIRQLFQVYKL